MKTQIRKEMKERRDAMAKRGAEKFDLPFIPLQEGLGEMSKAIDTTDRLTVFTPQQWVTNT